MGALALSEEFINEFFEFFGVKERDEKIVIYGVCSKLYEILLASDLMTAEEAQTYRSMAQLKTFQSMKSTIIGSHRNSLRKSSIIMKPMKNLSICQTYLKPENLLKKIGSNCSFLYPDIGF